MLTGEPILTGEAGTVGPKDFTWRIDMRTTLSFAAAATALLPAAGSAQAGCGKGAVAGGVVGHVAGKHGIAGAAIGCAIGHHAEKKKQKKQQEAAAAQSNAAPANNTAKTRK